MPMIKKAPVYLFVPFERVETGSDECIVTGCCFANEKVPGDNYRWKRAAVEAATEDYMRFANVREMHGKNAAGIATEVTWDETGCHMRAKIIDPIARLKCEEGVYKGFSLGIQPLLLRGDSVESLRWLETSLVDRPKDPDAVFTAYRADDLDPEGADCEVIEEAAADIPAEEAGLVKVLSERLAAVTQEMTEAAEFHETMLALFALGSLPDPSSADLLGNVVPASPVP